MSSKAIVSCPNCQAKNRVDLTRTAQNTAKCAKCAAELGVKNGIVNTTAAGLSQLIANADRPVVIDFWAPWCGPCVSFAPTFERVAADKLNDYIFVKVNTEAHPAAAQQYQVRGIPTLVKLTGGKETARQSGAMPEPMFRQWLQQG